jgi:hypothetical protein
MNKEVSPEATFFLLFPTGLPEANFRQGQELLDCVCLKSQWCCSLFAFQSLDQSRQKANFHSGPAHPEGGLFPSRGRPALLSNQKLFSFMPMMKREIHRKVQFCSLLPGGEEGARRCSVNFCLALLQERPVPENGLFFTLVADLASPTREVFRKS